MSAVETADVGSSVRDDIGGGCIPAMMCSDSPPARRDLSVAGVAAGGAGVYFANSAPKACALG